MDTLGLDPVLNVSDGGAGRSVCRSCRFLQTFPRMALPPATGSQGSYTLCIPYCIPDILLLRPCCALYFPLLPGYVFCQIAFLAPT